MIAHLCLLLLGSVTSSIDAPSARTPQHTRARVAVLLSDSDTATRRWTSISALDSLLPKYLAKRRLQYISQADVRTVIEGDGVQPSEWAEEDLLTLGTLFRATYMVDLRVSHASAGDALCARILRVQARAVVDSVCMQDIGSSGRAVRELAANLGRRLNQLSRVRTAARRPT